MPQREIRLVRLDGQVVTLEITGTQVMHDGEPAIQIDGNSRQRAERHSARQRLTGAVGAGGISAKGGYATLVGMDQPYLGIAPRLVLR